MRKGRQVSFFNIAGSDNKFTAAILATESNIEANTRTLKVRAVVAGKHNLLVPGRLLPKWLCNWVRTTIH